MTESESRIRRVRVQRETHVRQQQQQQQAQRHSRELLNSNNCPARLPRSRAALEEIATPGVFGRFH
jgi:hypothetical protein